MIILSMCVICALIQLESAIEELGSFKQFRNMPVNEPKGVVN